MPPDKRFDELEVAFNIGIIAPIKPPNKLPIASPRSCIPSFVCFVKLATCVALVVKTALSFCFGAGGSASMMVSPVVAFMIELRFKTVSFDETLTLIGAMTFSIGTRFWRAEMLALALASDACDACGEVSFSDKTFGAVPFTIALRWRVSPSTPAPSEEGRIAAFALTSK